MSPLPSKSPKLYKKKNEYPTLKMMIMIKKLPYPRFAVWLAAVAPKQVAEREDWDMM
jgi:hypothetical protein